MELVYIFCNPLLHNIIQVNCLTLYELTSLKIIREEKKNDPSLVSLCRVGGVTQLALVSFHIASLKSTNLLVSI